MFEAFWLQASKYIHPVPFYCYPVASFQGSNTQEEERRRKEIGTTNGTRKGEGTVHLAV